MDIFNVLSLIGGLSLFLFGMNIMGQALERRAGGRLRTLLGKLTTGKMTGLLTGLGITAVIQSSSATTVMVVGFVNSGLMTLRQAIHVIMGANIGTTVTAWVLSLAGIESSNLLVKLLKPSSFTPVFAFIGILLYLFSKDSRKKDTGMAFLGFATLMFGMEAMSGAVSGLRNIPEFQNLFVLFQNPILGVMAGAILTAIIQSSSASVGILQALAVTGKVTYGAAIPIIMGQNIGTCVTAMLSAIGANKNAKRAALVHLSFNVIGTVVLLMVFYIIKMAVNPAVLGKAASLFGIAVSHTIFNVLCTMLMLPLSAFLENLVQHLVPDAGEAEIQPELDERLLMTPPIALKQCHEVAVDMAKIAVSTLKDAMECFQEYSPDLAASIEEREEKTDQDEDMLDTYLVRLSGLQISETDHAQAAKLMKIIGDFERISDHGLNILKGAKEVQMEGLSFTKNATDEFGVITSAMKEILDLTLEAFLTDDLNAAMMVEALEQVIHQLKEQMRTRHVHRLQQGNCSIEAGFVWSDLLNDLERTSDHCSNIAVCIMDMERQQMNLHESLRTVRKDSGEYHENYKKYADKYVIF
jgi:phosphate:Na+ symporter